MICLIRPPATESFRFSTLTVTPPLGLAYIAGALEAAGHRPHVVDCVAAAPGHRTRYYKGYLVGLRLEEVVARIPDETRIVGISVIFTHEWPGVVRLVELIKRARPELTVVLGGEHITSMPEFCLRTSEADVLVLSEGEETIVELVEALQGDEDLDGVAGIAHRKGNRVVVNPRRVRIADVDGIPWPAWHLFDLQTYFENRFVGGIFTNDLTVPILATRGCPYQCTFCSAPNMWLPRWIPRDPVRVVDEIQHYVETMGARNFPFQDLTAIIRKDWIIAFCQELIDRGLDISWQMPSGTRSEAVDAEVASLLKRSGMISMAYAPESGSDETRRKIKKRVEADRLIESIRAAVSAELNVAVFIIIGFPHETRADVLENLPFLRRMAREGVTDVSVVFDMVLPGTEIFDDLYDAGRITIDRKYFRHMLHSLALWPSLSYTEHLGVLALMVLKLRLLAAFFGTRKDGGERGAIPIVNSLRRGLSGLKGGEHSSRLQTVFRNASVAIWDSFRVRFKPGWIPRSAERRMFSHWNEIYREIRTAGGGATARRSPSLRKTPPAAG
jgi:anaerobic magnesium-protoporphyrin IX monomethyl ester cyclase